MSDEYNIIDKNKDSTRMHQRKKPNPQTPSKIQLTPFTDREILKLSVAEITGLASCISKGINYTDYLIKRTNDETKVGEYNIFSETIFGSREKMHSTSMSTKCNFGHIDLKFPIVMPYTYAIENRNLLTKYLNINSTGALLRAIIEYNAVILIPKPNKEHLDEDEKDKNIHKCSINILTTTNKYKSLHNKVISGIDFTSNNPILHKIELSDKESNFSGEFCMPTFNFKVLKATNGKGLVSIPDKYKENYFYLGGANAIAFLFGFIDTDTIINNVDTLTTMFEVPTPSESKSTDAFRRQIEYVVSTSMDSEGSLLDIIATLVPVIPAIFREPVKTEINGGTQIDLQSINCTYNSIIKNKVSGATNVKHTVLYGAIKKYLDASFNPNSSVEQIGNLANILYNVLKDINLEESSSDYCIQSKKRVQALLASEFISNPNRESVLDSLGSKYGILRDKSSAKRIDRTFRGVIVVNPELRLDYVGIPLSAVLKWYKREIYEFLKANNSDYLSHLPEDSRGNSDRFYKYILHLTTSSKTNMVALGDLGDITFSPVNADRDQLLLETVRKKLDEILVDKRCLIIRYPSLHKYNELGFKIKVVTGNAVHFHPLVVTSYNADFDGDQISAFLIETPMAVKDVDEKLLPTKNLTDAKGQPLMSPTQEAILGLYYLTIKRETDNSDDTIPFYPSYDDMYNSYVNGEITLHDTVTVNYPHYTNSVFNSKYEKHSNYLDAVSRKHKTKKKKQLSTIDLEKSQPKFNLISESNTNDELLNQLEININEIEHQVDLNVEYLVKDNTSYPSKNITSTVGRFIFNSIIPQDLGFVNRAEDQHSLEIGDEYFEKNKIVGLPKKHISIILKEVVSRIDDIDIVSYILDTFKETGYYYITKSGFSLGLDDLNPPTNKQHLIAEYQKKVDKVRNNPNLSQEERDNQIAELWNKYTNEITDIAIEMMDIFNPLRMMVESGSRGNRSQIQQLLGSRGLMLDALGNLIPHPILSSFYSGIGSIESYIGSFGAAKGLIDKGNSTKDTGEMTRKLIFGLNEIVIKTGDCGDTEGFLFRDIAEYVIGDRDSVGNLYYENKQDSLLYPLYLFGQTVKYNLSGVDIPILDIHGNIYAPSTVYQGIPIYNIKHNRVLSSELWEKYTDFYSATSINNMEGIAETSGMRLWFKELTRDFIKFILVKVDQSPISLTKTLDSYPGLEITISLDGNRNHRIEQIVHRYDEGASTAELFNATSTIAQPPLINVDNIQITLTDIVTDGNNNIIDPNDENLELSVTNSGGVKYKYTNPTTNEEINAEISMYNVVNDFYGRYLAEDIIDEETGDVLISKNKMITQRNTPKSTLIKMMEQHPEGVYIRSPITCKASTLCCKCSGYNLSTNRNARVGDAIGLAAAHTLSEIISQATLRTFHTGGAASAGDIGSVFKVIQDLLIKGKINSKILYRMNHIDNGDVDIENRLESVCKNLPLVYTHSNNVKDKKFIDIDMNLPTGEPLPKYELTQDDYEEYKTKYFEPVILPTTLEVYGVAKYFVFLVGALSTFETVKSVFTSGGNVIPSIYFEVIVRKMFSSFEVIHSGDSVLMHNSVIPIDTLIETNTELIRRHKSPDELVAVIPKFSTLEQAAKPAHSHLQTTLYGNLKSSIAFATINRAVDDLSKGTLTSVLTGTKFNSGAKVVKNVRDNIQSGYEIKTKYDLLETAGKSALNEMSDYTSYVDNLSITANEIDTFGNEEFNLVIPDDIGKIQSELDNLSFNNPSEVDIPTHNTENIGEFTNISLNVSEQINEPTYDSLVIDTNNNESEKLNQENILTNLNISVNDGSNNNQSNNVQDNPKSYGNLKL